jgi:hypothetical protein
MFFFEVYFFWRELCWVSFRQSAPAMFESLLGEREWWFFYFWRGEEC